MSVDVRLQKYYLIKQARFRELERDLTERARTEGEAISCARGCAHCCRGYISGPEIEIELIYEAIKAIEFLKRLFLEKYEAWKKRIEPIRDVVAELDGLIEKIQSGGASPAERGRYFELMKRYEREGIDCPLLDNRECLIYAARPHVCANLCALTPPDMCRDDDPRKQLRTSSIPPAVPDDGAPAKFQSIIKGIFKKIDSTEHRAPSSK